MNTRGIIYLLVGGERYLGQLAVSLRSMREAGAWFGPVTILCGDDVGHASAQQFCSALGNAYETNAVRFPFESKRNAAYAFKPSIYQHSPYDDTIFVDADTLFTGKMLSELWPQSDEEIVLTQFVDWDTHGRRVGGRVRAWYEHAQDLVLSSLARGDKAVNTGIFAFRKTAKIFRDWHELTLRNVCFMCDEIACQLLYPHHPHRLLPATYNHSTRFPTHPVEDVVIWHGHGRQFIRHDCGRKVWLPWLDRTMEGMPWFKDNLSRIDPAAFKLWEDLHAGVQGEN